MATSMTTHDGAEAPRYGEMAGVENHPQITDYVPRRKRAVLGTLATGAAVAAAAELLTHAAPHVAATGVAPLGPLAAKLAGGLTAWTSAVALLAIAGLARLVWSLRRHRVDDVRGRYRVWRWVAWGSLAGSLNAVVGAHQAISAIAVAMTGWSITAAAAEWWLAPLALVGAWIGVRLAMEMGESRSALSMVAAGTICHGLAAAGMLGWTPAPLGEWADVLTVSLPLAGHTFALAGMMMFARYVVLDVQGLIDHAPSAAKPPKPAKKPKAAPAADAETIAMPKVPAAPAAAKQEPASSPQWDDQDEGEDEDGADHYLSKSERKRLRKQQQRRAA